MGNITSYQRECKECHNKHEKWCKSCQISEFEKNFKWTSGNEIIDNLIQEIQLKVENPQDIVFEWIPYDQFYDIKKIGEGGFAEVYSAMWNDGPLNYDDSKNEYTRNQNRKVALKCLHNSQNINNKFLNEV